MDRFEMIKLLKGIDKKYIWIGRSCGYGVCGILSRLDNIGIEILGTIGVEMEVMFVTEKDIDDSKRLDRLYHILYNKYINQVDIDWDEAEDEYSVDFVRFTYLVKIREDMPLSRTCYVGFSQYTNDEWEWINATEHKFEDSYVNKWEDLSTEKLSEWVDYYNHILHGKNSYYEVAQ